MSACLTSLESAKSWRRQPGAMLTMPVYSEALASLRGMTVCLIFYSVFFFQAEDGIRDDLVTGVQTCALPICTSIGPDLTRIRRLRRFIDRKLRADGRAKGPSLRQLLPFLSNLERDVIKIDWPVANILYNNVWLLRRLVLQLSSFFTSSS